MCETAPSFSSSATLVVGYKADNSDTTYHSTYLANGGIAPNYSTTATVNLPTNSSYTARSSSLNSISGLARRASSAKPNVSTPTLPMNISTTIINLP